MIELRQERTSDYRSSDDEFAVRSYFRGMKRQKDIRIL